MKKMYSVFVLPFILLCINTHSFAQDYNSYNNLAKEEYDKKNYYNVIDYANKSLNVSPNGAGYWYRGMGRYGLSNYSEAADDFTKALSYYSSDNTSLGGLYYWRALCRYNQSNYKESLPDFESAKNYGYEDKINMYWSMAYATYKIADYKKAAELYTTSMNYTSDRSILAKLYKGRGDSNDELFKTDDAISDYTKALEYNPGYSYAFWSRGISRALKFQYDLAIGDYTSAINILEKENKSENTSDLSTLYSNRGRMQYLSDKNDEAKADLQKSLSLNPNNDRGNWNMGDVLYSLKNYEEAIRYYAQSASLLTKEADKKSCYRSLYFCSINMLDYTQALSYINSAIDLKTEDGDLYGKRAHIYSVKKNYAASLADYNKAIELYSDDKYGFYKSTRAGLYGDRAQVKIKMKDNTGAASDFQKAIDEDTTSLKSYYEFGRFYMLVAKQPNKAMPILQKAAKVSADMDTANYAYAKVVKGDKQEAIATILSATKRDIDNNSENLKWDYYNAACIYALANDAPKALQYLDKAFKAGFDNYDHLLNDYDLDKLRLSPAYKTILVKYKIPQPK